MNNVLIEEALRRAIAAEQSGDLDRAQKDLQHSLEIDPNHPMARNNLAVLVARRGNPAAALQILGELIASNPGYPSAYFNRANVFLSLGRTENAIADFINVTELDPNNVDAHRSLGFQWLAKSNRGRAMDHFARTYELRRGEDRTGIAQKSLRTSSSEKLKHDADLFRHLPSRAGNKQRFESLANLYEMVAAGLNNDVVELSDEQIKVLGPDYNTAINIKDAPEMTGAAINSELDCSAIQTAWGKGGAKVTMIENLLTPKALLVLRKFLMQSTIWHDFAHIDGFVATYLEDGFACPLVLQIADEFRAALPSLLGPHPLTQAWAFKALSGKKPIAPHADDAAVSLNFWITPDIANQNPETGGLIVYTAPSPENWPIVDYDADQVRIKKFLSENGDSAVSIPYRENRGVLFQSRMFHGTDSPDFLSGYENHRINITFLFGNNKNV